MPRHAVFPKPDPGPRPTRFAAGRDPPAGFNSFSRILTYLYPDQMGNLVNHSLNRWRIFQLNSLVDPSQSQSMYASQLPSAPAKLALDQGDLDFLITH